MLVRSRVDHKKAQAERLQAMVHELLTEEDNKYCADCEAKQPRWASWNLGVFICIRCAGIHRSIGVQVSRVKSVNLDAWTPEQVQSMRVMGNAKAKKVYEAQLPENYRRPQNEQQLESFIRAKYEHKRYILKDWDPPKVDISELFAALEKMPVGRNFHRRISGPPSASANTPVNRQMTVIPVKTPQPAPASEVQLLDLSDSAAADTKTHSQAGGSAEPLDLLQKQGGVGDYVSQELKSLHISPESPGQGEGPATDELEDVFGPIVSAPRTDSLSEPPVELPSDATACTSGAGTVQQSASASNLGDLASLSSTDAAANHKISNSDILALFESTPKFVARPSAPQNSQPQMIPQQFHQANVYADLGSGTTFAGPPAMQQPVAPMFQQVGGLFAPNFIPHSQPAYGCATSANLPEVPGMMGNFVSRETMAMFAAASPFANSSNTASNIPGMMLSGGLPRSEAMAEANVVPTTGNYNNFGNGCGVTSTNVTQRQWPTSSVPSVTPSAGQNLDFPSGAFENPHSAASNGFADFSQLNMTGGVNVKGPASSDGQKVSLWD